MNKRNLIYRGSSSELPFDQVERTTTVVFRAYAPLTWIQTTVLQTVLKSGLEALGWVVSVVTAPTMLPDDEIQGTLSVTFLLPKSYEETVSAQLDADLFAVLGLYSFQFVSRSPLQPLHPSI